MGLDGSPREVSERTFSRNMAPRGLEKTQDDLKDKMLERTQDASHRLSRCSNKPQERSKTAPKGLQDRQGGL
eukprot:8045482-Pyramimonas_sp.AAC.1